MRIENLSFRKVVLAIATLGFLSWAIDQFLLLPQMTEQERKGLYRGWGSTPYPYAISMAFVFAASWYVFRYRGRYATREGKIVLFAMMLGTLCGLLLIMVIRVTWHI
jgi:hypothetical protein